MKQSSVSPDLWDTIVPQPLLLASRCAAILSVTEPIWFTFNRRQLHAFFSTAVVMRVGLVTVRSSPTIWMGVAAVILVQFAQSSWSKGSSMEVMGNSLQKSRYIWQSLSPSIFGEPSLLSGLKSRS